MADHLWWLLFSCVAGIGFFVSILMVTGKTEVKKGSRPLIALIFLFSLTLVQFVILWTESTKVFPHLHNLWQVSNFLYGPLLFMHVTNSKRKWLWLHFSLAIILITMWLPYGVMSTADKIEYLEQNHYPFYSEYLPTNYLLYLSLWYISAIIQAGYALYFIYLSFIKKSHANKLTRLLAVLFSIFVVARVSYFVLREYEFFNPQWDYMISLAMSICIFRIGFMAIREPEYFYVQKVLEVTGVKKYKTTSMSTAESAILAQRIRSYLEEHKSYLDPTLRLPALASLLETKSHHMSQAINEHFQQSFSDFINSYRIAHACELLSDEQVSAKEAGYQSGFNNLATFYKAFKKVKQITPAKFQANLLKEV